MLKLAVVASERKVGPSKSEIEYSEDQCVVMETQGSQGEVFGPDLFWRKIVVWVLYVVFLLKHFWGKTVKFYCPVGNNNQHQLWKTFLSKQVSLSCRARAWYPKEVGGRQEDWLAGRTWCLGTRSEILRCEAGGAATSRHCWSFFCWFPPQSQGT